MADPVTRISRKSHQEAHKRFASEHEKAHILDGSEFRASLQRASEKLKHVAFPHPKFPCADDMQTRQALIGLYNATPNAELKELAAQIDGCPVLMANNPPENAEDFAHKAIIGAYSKCDGCHDPHH